MKLNFESHFTIETPKNTLTIKATGEMQPGRPAYISGPPEDCYPAEDDEIIGTPHIEITGENGEAIAFDDLPEKIQERISDGIYAHAEYDDHDSDVINEIRQYDYE